jgi:gamma-glutamyltranspeptidase/glutathione hydrolase
LPTETSARVARGTRGIVTTGHAHATDAALHVLANGGNAVDAAVVAALVLAVVCPYATSLGGEFFALVYDPRTQQTIGLNATGLSPAATAVADPARNGPHSATIPALVRGLDDLWRRYGTQPWATLAEPAIALANDGFAVNRVLADNTRERAELLLRDAAARALFLPGDEPLREGAIFVQPDLARTLQEIAADGAVAFYDGPFAQRFVDGCAASGATIRAADLAEHTSLWQTPLSVPFYGRQVWTMPPNSYGPTLLLQLIDLVEMKIASIDADDPAFIDAGIEARRRAYAAAAPWTADPRETEWKAAAYIAAAVANAHYDPPGERPPEPRDRCTTNAVIIDGDGLAVSLVESVSAPYGAGVVVPGTGVLLNNRMAGFNRNAKHANGIAPRKRPANTLAPCIVTRNGALELSLGTPGTVGQTCTLAQFLARAFAHGEELASAAAAPRWSVDFEGLPVVEDTMDARLRDAVLARHPKARVMPAGWISFGSIKLAAVTGTGYEGVADARRAATTAGW